MNEDILNELVEEVSTIKEQLNGLDSVADKLDSVTRLLDFMLKEQEKTNELLKEANNNLGYIETNTQQ